MCNNSVLFSAFSHSKYIHALVFLNLKAGITKNHLKKCIVKTLFESPVAELGYKKKQERRIYFCISPDRQNKNEFFKPANKRIIMYFI